MRKEKELIVVLRGLVDLLADEAARNSDFANKLDSVLNSLPAQERSAKQKLARGSVNSLPDLHSEWSARGEVEFIAWLRELPIAILRALIRSNDFDPVGRTSKWKETEKLSSFIVDSLRARMARGSAFMSKGPVS
jgi:hypothetical protein